MAEHLRYERVRASNCRKLADEAARENMTFLLCLAVVVLALVIAWWQYKEVTRARSGLRVLAEGIPDQIAAGVKKVAELTRSDSPNLDKTDFGVSPINVNYLDLDGDGKKELLIQYPLGAHGSALRVLGWREGRFDELASISVGTPVGFDFGDFDGDGKIEVKTEETDWHAGLPYVSAPRVLLLLRWEDGKFSEVSRTKKSE
jgi:hypothetical protein